MNIELFHEAYAKYMLESEQEVKQEQKQGCQHLETIEMNWELVCEDCGEILEKIFFERDYSEKKEVAVTRRTVFEIIPYEKLSRKTVDMCIQMYNFITFEYQSKRKFQKGIMCACINIAAALNKDVFVFSIKDVKRERKCFEYVVIKIKDEYGIEYEQIIELIMFNKIQQKLNRTFPIDKIKNILSIINEKSDIFFHSGEILNICVVVYFWMTLSSPIDVKRFCEKLNISKSILLKKYNKIKSLLISIHMKHILKNMLKNNKSCELVGDNGLTFCNIQTTLTIRNSKFQNLPIESIIQLSEWNDYIFNAKYYDAEQNEFVFKLDDQIIDLVLRKIYV